MKETLKKYFDEAIKTDEALKNVYEESKIEGCQKYIMDQAKKYLNGVSGYIEPEIVYKWARDYMYGDIETKAPADNKTSQDIPENLSEENIEPEEKPAVETVEEMKEEPMKIEKVIQTTKKSKKEPIYDGPDLFDFNDLY